MKYKKGGSANHRLGCADVMKIHGSVIIEQGVTFAVVAVQPSVTRYTIRSTQMRMELKYYFPNMPIILMSMDKNGQPHYYGRKDIVEFLKSINVNQIPWKEYHIY